MKKVLSILLCAVMALGLFGCSGKANQETQTNGQEQTISQEQTSNESQTEETQKKYEVDEGLIDVKITIPASMFSKENPATDELTQKQKDSGFKAAKLNEDGSVTYTLTKKAYKEYLKTLKAQTKDALNSFGEEFKSVKSVENNDDFSKITIKVDRAAYEKSMDFFAIVSAGMLGSYYQAFAGYEGDKISSTVQVVDQNTGDVINTGTYPKRG